MPYSIRLFEVTLKNLYSQISKVRRKIISLDDMDILNTLDPTTKFRNPKVAGAYLHWIISDYFNRYKNKTVEQYVEEQKEVIPLLIKKYHRYRGRRLVSSPDLAKYTYDSLVKEIAELEDEFGMEIYGYHKEGKDYITLNQTGTHVIYEVLTAEGMTHIGKYSTWCIAKNKSFLPDTFHRKEAGGKTLVLKFLNEQNSVPEYRKECEYYCVTVLPDHQIDEIVNANNESLFYTDKEKILWDLVKAFI